MYSERNILPLDEPAYLHLGLESHLIAKTNYVPSRLWQTSVSQGLCCASPVTLTALYCWFQEMATILLLKKVAMTTLQS